MNYFFTSILVCSLSLSLNCVLAQSGAISFGENNDLIVRNFDLCAFYDYKSDTFCYNPDTVPVYNSWGNFEEYAIDSCNKFIYCKKVYNIDFLFKTKTKQKYIYYHESDTGNKYDVIFTLEAWAKKNIFRDNRYESRKYEVTVDNYHDVMNKIPYNKIGCLFFRDLSVLKDNDTIDVNGNIIYFSPSDSSNDE